MVKRYPATHSVLILTGLWCGLSMGACGREPAPRDGLATEHTPQPAPPKTTYEPYTETISGTTVEFRMVPVSTGVVGPDAPDGDNAVEVGAFYISATEVTWDMFDVFVYALDIPPDENAGADAVTRPSKPYVPPDRGFGHAGFPAISMTYQAAERFCEWLSDKTGRTYRLPTEAEWMLVAQRCAGDADLAMREWYDANANAQTQAVAQKHACDLGVYDILGNAAEWATGADRKPVLCGGAYSDAADLISAQTRRKQTPAWNMSDPQMPKSKWWLPDAPFVGFRIVCEIEEGAGDE